MPDAPELPADLIALQQAWNDAHASIVAFCAEVEARRRAGGDIRPWAPEETEELDQLRADETAALKALRGHPVVVAAQGDGTWKQLHTALKVATGAEGWTAAKGK